jgi:hypothetical protein
MVNLQREKSYCTVKVVFTSFTSYYVTEAIEEYNTYQSEPWRYLNKFIGKKLVLKKHWVDPVLFLSQTL